LKIAVFSSVRDPAALALITALLEAEINVEVPWVFRDRIVSSTDEELKRVLKKHNIPLFSYDSIGFEPELRKSHREEWGVSYDREVVRVLQGAEQPEIVVLLGYMWKLSEVLCNLYSMLNLHPSLPGKYQGTWKQVTWKVFDNGDEITGSMFLWVTKELDGGPPATFCEVYVKGCSVDEIRRLQFCQEEPLMLATLRAIANNEIAIRRPTDVTICSPVNLTAEVEMAMREREKVL